MRILVMGSGGLGTAFGARLAHAGADVIFVARGLHLKAMQEHGITLDGGPESICLPKVNAIPDPASAGIVDVVMFCVKLWDTVAAAEAILPNIGEHTAVMSFQNGVTKDKILQEIVPKHALMGAVGYIAAVIERPGVISQTGPMQRLVFGEFDGSASERARKFKAACVRGGIEADFSQDIRREIWIKYIFNVAISGATTTMRLPFGPIRANPLTRAFFLDLMREAVAVGRACGIDLPEDYAEQRLARAETAPANLTSSMHHDIERGRPLEVEWLSGTVADLGAKLGIPTPANRAVRDILILHAKGRQQPA